MGRGSWSLIWFIPKLWGVITFKHLGRGTGKSLFSLIEGRSGLTDSEPTSPHRGMLLQEFSRRKNRLLSVTQWTQKGHVTGRGEEEGRRQKEVNAGRRVCRDRESGRCYGKKKENNYIVNCPRYRGTRGESWSEGGGEEGWSRGNGCWKKEGGPGYNDNHSHIVLISRQRKGSKC